MLAKYFEALDHNSAASGAELHVARDYGVVWVHERLHRVNDQAKR